METAATVTSRRWWPDRLLAMLLCVPVLAITLFYAYVVTWRLRLGHWPKSGYPDAGLFEGLDFAFAKAIYVLIRASMTVVAPLGLIVGIASWMQGQRRVLLVATVLAACVALRLWLYLDPGQFVSWYID